jgi:hypothetical protein
MNEVHVFKKTANGQAEVAARSGSLTMSMRRVLIMIDGKRTVAELAPLLRPGEIDGVIAALLEKGYVESVGVEAPPAARPNLPNTIAPAPRTLSDVSDPNRFMSIDETKRRVVRELTDRLGPEAEYLALKIEQCRTVDELRARIRDAERLLTNAISERAAQEFRQALRRR